MTTAFCIAGAGAFYALAMVLMKTWGSGPGAILALAIAATFVLGAVLEVTALRQTRMGVVYCAILGVEAMLVLLASHHVFGETYSAREWAGGALVLAGVALVSAA